MKFFYSDVFNLPLPKGHRFPGQKYRMLREKLISERILEPHHLQQSPIAERRDVERAHTPSYVSAVLGGNLTRQQERAIGLPWSPQLVQRSLATIGGQLAAVESALKTGLSGQLAGGTHHASADQGAGFCVFNDQACAAAKALSHGWASRIAILDLDVHQGDGTALIMASNPNCLVISIHGARNYPFEKVASDIDIALPDGIDDATYLRELQRVLPKLWEFQPDLLLYQAGVDPHADDKLGRMNLSFEGLLERDRLVLTQARDKGVAVSMAIGGGYANPIDSSVTAYANTYRVARDVYRF